MHYILYLMKSNLIIANTQNKRIYNRKSALTKLIENLKNSNIVSNKNLYTFFYYLVFRELFLFFCSHIHILILCTIKSVS